MRFSSQEPTGNRTRWLTAAVLAIALAATALATSAFAGATSGAGEVSQHNLVSDQAGKADLKDGDLVNAWGLAFGPATPAWVANNGSDNSTLYMGGGGTPVTKIPLTVSIPGGAPTGMVFNSSPGFRTSTGAGTLHIRLRGREDHRLEHIEFAGHEGGNGREGEGSDLQGPRDRQGEGRREALRDRLPPRQGRRLRRQRSSR